MQFNSIQLEVAHQLGEAILRFVLATQTPSNAGPLVHAKFGSENRGDNRLMSAREAAQLLSISRGMIYQLMNSGRLPSVPFGRSRRFKLAEIIKLMENGAP